MASPFITTQDLTDHLGISVLADPGATIALDVACDMVRTAADQTFNKGTATTKFDGTGTDTLILPRLPVVSAGTVLVSGGTVTDYTVDTERGLLIRKLQDQQVVDWWTTDPIPSVVWPAGRQNVQVTYVHGYDDADLPRDVRGIALQVAERIVVQGVAQFESVGDVSMRYAANAMELTPGERMILYKYRNGRRND
jgi:hypothetical protein